ncbi:efflux RND transporter periplasmic adaptor subunit [Planctomycetes bacterium K23_9]|uniref:Periplasmic multidrug efflux lipoprotein n=1 Tax=Stieleria marina TaxID=1930275 RepID=A0A517NY08_9BACT|nr:periplasmic multidrug efflux lipoprotein precursor [Planctomycetes bacterium K23_9]
MKPSLTLASTTLALATVVMSGQFSAAGTIESFVEPYRRVAIPAPEIGVLADISVVEGDQVSKDQIVAKLDDSILRSSAKVARAAMESTGTLLAAESDNDSRLNQLDSYKQLKEQGNASPREYQRALSEQAKSAARLQTAKEELELRRLEFERVNVQIARRQITSPLDGTVVAIDKEAGEFVSPTDPVVMHVVQIDTLKTVFSVPRSAAVDVAVGQQVELSVGYEAITCTGTIDFVSPIADPQSGTVRVKLRIANLEGKLQSGSVCRWNLEGYESDQRISNAPTSNQR